MDTEGIASLNSGFPLLLRVAPERSVRAVGLVEINREQAIADLFPLAQNYLSSAVFERVEKARAALSVPSADRGPRPGSPAGVGVAGGYAGSNEGYSLGPRGETGLWSEL